MGTTDPTRSAGRFGVEGPKDNPDPRLARLAILDQAERFGLAGMLAAMAPGVRAPAAAWGSDAPSGRDPRSALGAMFDTSIDDAAGAGGLDLFGPGPGGGGHEEGIGVRDLAAGLDPGDGRGWGSLCGSCPEQGIGGGLDKARRGHPTAGLKLREPEATVNGRLRPEIIQRIVRQNFGRFRFCYEKGVRKSPGLEGRVAVDFVIDRTGAVSLAAQDRSTDLPDGEVAQCVVRAFRDLSFPAPDGGQVTVTYPLVFTPE
jgi:hypothetical protein